MVPRIEDVTVSHFDEIKSELADDAYETLERRRGEALVDALMLVSKAEGEADEREETEVEQSVEEIRQRARAMPEDYPNQARQKARQADGDPEAIRAMAREIVARLEGDETLIEEAYYLAARVAAIDVNVMPDETRVLETFVDVFEMPRERLKILTRRLRHEV